MKKSILIVLLLVLLVAAVGVSGCLGGDDPAVNSPNNNSTNGPNGPNGSANATPDATFNGSIVTVSVQGYELLAVQSVIASERNILGVDDALKGFRASYLTPTNTNVHLSAYQTESNASAQGYVQSMINAHNNRFGNNSNVTTVDINGNNATLFTTITTAGGGNVERFRLAWASGDILVIVDGPTTFNEIRTIAEASDL